MAQEAKVVISKIADNVFLAGGQSMVFSWKIEQTKVWWFHAVPRVPQYSFPQTIQIDRVSVSISESLKVVAHVKLTNPGNASDYPDGCHFSLYVAVASPIP